MALTCLVLLHPPHLENGGISGLRNSCTSAPELVSTDDQLRPLYNSILGPLRPPLITPQAVATIVARAWLRVAVAFEAASHIFTTCGGAVARCSEAPKGTKPHRGHSRVRKGASLMIELPATPGPGRNMPQTLDSRSKTTTRSLPGGGEKGARTAKSSGSTLKQP